MSGMSRSLVIRKETRKEGKRVIGSGVEWSGDCPIDMSFVLFTSIIRLNLESVEIRTLSKVPGW